MVKTLDIAWLAGLLEGEGSFYLSRGTNPTITLGMTDEDVVRRVALLMGVDQHVYRQQLGSGKPFFRIAILGSKAHAWMMTLACLMGKRRKEKIFECLRSYMNNPRRRTRSVSDPCIHGHEGRMIVDKRGTAICRTCSNQRSLVFMRKKRSAVKMAKEKEVKGSHGYN